ncbi:GNAT family N-acetyltransferase [Selenihalanaerobacter shriftii]|uniref:Ribosomal-protein-alanine N-acetyltransferase n=1 Tax=Selenihalanaerobacter shriftii TaxID=142842 RepID=A0A1T4PXF0_9FIRM|nr:GNAT family N-acetyltransferase [Selenihalanaerobacter shriftii]SJZ96183.1 ribosomal-protein-alanine N-acetyltransferase [Selenihalanaerobacter shriftii]
MEYRIEVLDEYNNNLLDELVNLETQAFGTGGLNKWHLVPFINHGKVIVIYNSTEPVGLAEIMRDFDNPELAYIFGLSIKEEYHNQGLGSEVLNYTLEWLANRDIKEVELTVAPDNEPAYHIYKDKFDFYKEEHRPEEYGKDEPRLVMKLSL